MCCSFIDCLIVLKVTCTGSLVIAASAVFDA